MEDNPETQWHHDRLVQERQGQQHSGLVLFLLGIGLLMFALVSWFWLKPEWLERILSLVNISGLVLLLAFPLVFLVLGGGLSLLGRRPLTQTTIARHRRKKRIELFRMAQGRVPWYCRKATLRITAGIGLALLLTGIVLEAHVLTATDRLHTRSLILGLGDGLGGLVLLLQALVLLPRRLKQIPSSSARLLAWSLTAGEQSARRAEDGQEGE